MLGVEVTGLGLTLGPVLVFGKLVPGPGLGLLMGLVLGGSELTLGR